MAQSLDSPRGSNLSREYVNALLDYKKGSIEARKLREEAEQFQNNHNSLHEFITHNIVVSPAAGPIPCLEVAASYIGWKFPRGSVPSPHTVEDVVWWLLESSRLAGSVQRSTQGVYYLLNHRELAFPDAPLRVGEERLCWTVSPLDRMISERSGCAAPGDRAGVSEKDIPPRIQHSYAGAAQGSAAVNLVAGGVVSAAVGAVGAVVAKGLIYFMAEEPFCGRIKVGISENPCARVRALQHGHANKLVLRHVCEVDAYKRMEKAVHQIYADAKINGEWFGITESQLAGLIGEGL